MKTKSYGVKKQHQVESDLDRHLEELSIVGFTILENVLKKERLVAVREKLDRIYEKQESDYGAEELRAISELNLVRCPLVYDDFFLQLITEERILEVVKANLGSFFVLHLQNGIISLPDQEHHQSLWHRDLPYQDFEISKPLAVNALYCVEDFSPETGGTVVLPFSHRLEKMPSESFISNHQKTVRAEAGSVIMFDSMLYHRAGYNSSQETRRAINHVYAAGILKQQINIPKMLGDRFGDDPFLRMLLGYESQTPDSVDEYRVQRHKKMKSR